VSIGTDHGPGGLIVTADAIYVGNHRGGSIQRIDPVTNRVVSTILVGGQLGVPIAADPAVPMWVCTHVDGALHQVDLTTGRVMAAVAADCDGGWHNIFNGQVWAVSGGDTPNLRIVDANSGQVLRIVPVKKYTGAPIPVGDKVIVGSPPGGATLVFNHRRRKLGSGVAHRAGEEVHGRTDPGGRQGDRRLASGRSDARVQC
jgi:DNA-binding beta-propeller fold protein YncE